MTSATDADQTSVRIIRQWKGRVARVITVDAGQHERTIGHIRMVPAVGDWRCGWRVLDHTGTVIVDRLHGDYVDAEAVLLHIATASNHPPGRSSR